MALARPKCDYVVKLLLRGRDKSGKTALMNRFCKNEFSLLSIPSIGLDFSITTFPLADQGVTVKAQVRGP